MSDRVDFFMPGEGVAAKPYNYTGCGLDYVYLLNGVTVENDEDYGEIITIKAQKDLHKAIGLHIVQKRTMSNKEFKFLRKFMGVTQEELSWELQVDVQTVANYEKKGRIPGNSQKLMRFEFALFLLPPTAKTKVLSALIKRCNASESPSNVVVRRERKTVAKYWHEKGQLAAA